jgi:hypothetical protein
VRSLTFVAEVAARSFESHDFQLLPVGLLESVFGFLATASERLDAVAELYRHWEEHGAQFPQRYYMHIAEPSDGVLALEAHHADRRVVGTARKAVLERRIIDSIVRELGLTLAGDGVRGRVRAGSLLAVRALSEGGQKLEVATRETLDTFRASGSSGSSGPRGATRHVRTRILVAPLTELVMQRTPGLVDR